MFLFLPEDRSDFVCTKCKLVSVLEENDKGLETQVPNLHCIRENEGFLDRSQLSVLQAQHAEESERAVQKKEENWQHVTSRRRKRRTHEPTMLTAFQKPGLFNQYWIQQVNKSEKRRIVR
ncbi:unnamed protein product [Natator depressus]